MAPPTRGDADRLAGHSGKVELAQNQVHRLLRQTPGGRELCAEHGDEAVHTACDGMVDKLVGPAAAVDIRLHDLPRQRVEAGKCVAHIFASEVGPRKRLADIGEDAVDVGGIDGHRVEAVLKRPVRRANQRVAAPWDHEDVASTAIDDRGAFSGNGRARATSATSCRVTRCAPLGVMRHRSTRSLRREGLAEPRYPGARSVGRQPGANREGLARLDIANDGAFDHRI